MTDQIEDHVEDVEDQIDTDDSAQAVVVDADEVDAPEPAPQWADEDAEEARLFGWKSPDEWQGEKPQGYIDNPQEFLDRVQRSRIFKTMQDKVSKTEQQAQDHARKLEAMNARALENQRAQYDQQMQQIVAAQRRAVMEGDTEQFDALEGRKAGLQKASEEAAKPPEQPQGPDPYVQSYFESKNGAWLKNPILQSTARALIDANPAVLVMDAKAQIDYAEAAVRKLYPGEFQQDEAPKPKPRPMVDGGGLAQGPGRASGAFQKLPGEAKTQFERFVREGLFSDTKEDREDYANEYNAS